MNSFEHSSFYKKKAKEINLKDLYNVLKRRIRLIILVTALATAVGLFLNSFSVTPLYQASARVIIGADQASITTLQVIIKDPTILDKVVRDLNLKTNSDALANQIDVSSINGSQVVSITVTDANPELAAQIANTTALVFKNEVPVIVGQDYVRLLSDAQVNPFPINPKNNKKVETAAVIGIIAGIGLAFLLDSLDDSVKSETEIERQLGLPVLGKISKISNKNTRKKKTNLELRGETIGFK